MEIRRRARGANLHGALSAEKVGRTITPMPDDDPQPVPPQRPDSDACCRGACQPCIFDVYADALERYRADLAAWERRHAGDASPEG